MSLTKFERSAGGAIARRAVCVGIFVGAFVSAPAWAHNRGNHAGDWGPNDTIRICVCPGGEDFLPDALTGAISTWNNSKAGFLGGVTLEWTLSLADCSVDPPAECDVVIDWADNRHSWGTVGAGTGPVPVEIESNDGITARGVQRILLHELGHVKGLGHSALSDIMPSDYRGGTAEGLNSEDDLETPNADDIALNKELHAKPSAEELSKSDATATTVQEGSVWRYHYDLCAQTGTSFVDPVTRFTLEMPGVFPEAPGDLQPVLAPEGWNVQFFPRPEPLTKALDLDEHAQQATITFWTDVEAAGVLPGQCGVFEILSPWPPADGRGYTNSPSFDTDEFLLKVPEGDLTLVDIPTLSEWGLLAMSLLVLTAGTVMLAHRSRGERRAA